MSFMIITYVVFYISTSKFVVSDRRMFLLLERGRLLYKYLLNIDDVIRLN